MEQAKKAKKEGGRDLKYKNGSERMEEEAKTAEKGVRRDEEENGGEKGEWEVRELGMKEGGIVMKGKAEMRKGRGMTRMGRWLWMMMLIWRLLFCGGF